MRDTLAAALDVSVCAFVFLLILAVDMLFDVNGNL